MADLNTNVNPTDFANLGLGQVIEVQENQPSQEELIEMWDRGYELGRAHQRERDSDLREAGIVL